MSVSYGAIGTLAQGTSTIAVDMPAGVVAGSGLVCAVGFGEASNTVPTCTDVAHPFTYIGSAFGGSGSAFAIDDGKRGVAYFWREADGTEVDADTVNFAIAGSATNRLIVGQIMRFDATLNGWVTPVFAGIEEDDFGTAFSEVAPNNLGGAANGDHLILGIGAIPDTRTVASQAITWTGTGTATMTARSTVGSTQGGDMRFDLSTRAVTGTSSGSPTMSATLSGSGVGVMTILRLRDQTVAPPAFSGWGIPM